VTERWPDPAAAGNAGAQGLLLVPRGFGLDTRRAEHIVGQVSKLRELTLGYHKQG
jgi:hypothetical protein